jgi:VWFA-related protein
MPRRVLAVVACVVALVGVRSDAQQPASGQPPTSAPAPALPAGQQPATPPTPTFRTRIDSVSVDVIVTDKQGRPVGDLKAEDFEITENKKAQAIQAFKLIKVVEPDQAEPAYVRDITSLDEMQRETARDDVRLLVIFLDDYHVRRANAMRIRQDVAKFVSQLGSRDLIAVMYPLTPVGALTFSRNQDATAAAIMGFDGRKYDYIPRNPYEERYADYPPEALEVLRRQITLSALEGVSRWLGTLRDGKKLVLFVSEGIAGTLPPGTVTTSVNGRGSVPNVGTQSQQDRQSFFNQVDVLSEMREVFAAAARSNTSIYTLDPRGLATSEFQINDNVNSENDRRTLNESMDSLRVLASNTDGRAIVNRNDPAPELKRMMGDLSAYYLLGYTSTEAPRDGKFHEIQVRVKRKDVEVRARKGYWAYTADDLAKAANTPKEGPSPAVEEALSTLAEASREHAVRLWVGSARGENGRAAVTLAWEASADPAAEAAARTSSADQVDHITLTATSMDGTTLFKGLVPRDPQSLRPGGRINFDAPPGGVRLLVNVENATGLRIDHDDKSVDVPDFTNVGPLITTPVVFRARTARDLQQIRASSTPLPTVNRVFSRTERLLIRFQAYGPAGTTPTIAMNLLNSNGKSMAALPAPTRLPDGTFESELGLGPLAPGQYLVQITAEAASDKTQTLLAIRVTG